MPYVGRGGYGLRRKPEPNLIPIYVPPPDYGAPPEDETICMACKAAQERIHYHLERPGAVRVDPLPNDGCASYRVDNPLRLCKPCYYALSKSRCEATFGFVGPRKIWRQGERHLPLVDFYGPGWLREMKEEEDRLPAFAHEAHRDYLREQADFRADMEYARDFNR